MAPTATRVYPPPHCTAHTKVVTLIQHVSRTSTFSLVLNNRHDEEECLGEGVYPHGNISCCSNHKVRGRSCCMVSWVACGCLPSTTRRGNRRQRISHQQLHQAATTSSRVAEQKFSNVRPVLASRIDSAFVTGMALASIKFLASALPAPFVDSPPGPPFQAQPTARAVNVDEASRSAQSETYILKLPPLLPLGCQSVDSLTYLGHEAARLNEHLLGYISWALDAQS